MQTSPHYNLIIDEKRDEAMAVVYSYLYNTGQIEVILQELKHDGLEEAWIEMQKEISDKQHTHKWCKSSDCRYTKKKK